CRPHLPFAALHPALCVPGRPHTQWQWALCSPAQQSVRFSECAHRYRIRAVPFLLLTFSVSFQSAPPTPCLFLLCFAAAGKTKLAAALYCNIMPPGREQKNANSVIVFATQRSQIFACG